MTYEIYLWKKKNPGKEMKAFGISFSSSEEKKKDHNFCILLIEYQSNFVVTKINHGIPLPSELSKKFFLRFKTVQN